MVGNSLLASSNGVIAVRPAVAPWLDAVGEALNVRKCSSIIGVHRDIV